MKKIFLSWLLIAIINCSKFATAKDWCSVDCHVSPGPHVLCQYSPNSASKTCGKVQQMGLTSQDKRDILNAHNELRRKVANGWEKRGKPGPQPPATNMPDLVWDDQLAYMGQAWANQCDTNHHRCSHLSSSFSDQVGQNMGVGSRKGFTFRDIVDMWYNEVSIFNNKEAKKFVWRAGPPYVAHYTQVVWAKTTKVGCGGIKYMDNGYLKVFMVCNYSPAGNLPGAPVY